MDLVTIILHAIDHIVTAWSRNGAFVMNAIEDALKVPLRELGLHGAAETVCVALVPILSLIAVWRFFRGIFRILIMIPLVIFALHALWPLTVEIPTLFRDVSSSI